MGVSATLLALGSVLTSVNVANAATFNFSFINQDGTVNGTVQGTITLPDGNGTFAATSVIVTSAPAGLGLTIPANALAGGFIQNTFNVVAGAINIATSNFLGLINADTALGFNSTFNIGGTFLDALNAADLGATGVRDADSSTLTFSAAPSATTPEPTSVISLIGVGVLGIASKLKKKG